MKLYYSRTVTITCTILVLLMLRASYWQWQRHRHKLEYIDTLKAHLTAPIVELTDLQQQVEQWSSPLHRRVEVSGRFDFEHEVVLRNRRFDGQPGVFVLTPLLIDGSEDVVVVNRGFVPLRLAAREARTALQRNERASFVGLVKETSSRVSLAPNDPPAGNAHAWVDAWLRVDLERMAKQLPYRILPVYLEIMHVTEGSVVQKEIVSAKSARDDLFFLPGKTDVISTGVVNPSREYPVPVFDTIIPPARHFGYIFEWAAMAVMTILIGLVLQLRPSRNLILKPMV